MKKFIRNIFVVMVLWGISVSSGYAQLDNIDQFVQGIGNEDIKHDAELLMTGYLEPFVDGFASGLSGGWYNTAKPHKKLGFDITFTGTGVLIPDEKLLYNVNDLDFKELAVTSGGPEVPTIAGEDQEEATLQSQVSVGENDYPLAEFTTPKGTGLKTLVVPAVKAGIGLPFKTDLMVKYMPQLSIQDVEFGLWGLGLKHSLKQWIPIVKRVPALHLSAMAAYTKFNSSAKVNFTPAEMDENIEDNTTPGTFDDQNIALGMGSFTGNILASIDIPVLTVYAGLGVVSNTSELALKGNYPTSVSYDVAAQQPVVGDDQVEEDPLTLDFDTEAVDGLIPRANIGFRLKFAVITLHAGYVYSNYSLFTGGLGVSFR